MIVRASREGLFKEAFKTPLK